MPDIERLVAMSEFFGISVDEMVKESAAVPTDAEGETDGEATVVSEGGAPPQTIIIKHEHKPVETRKILGICFIVLACVAVLLQPFWNSELEVGVWSAVPYVLCAAICFGVRKNTAFFCGCAAYGSLLIMPAFVISLLNYGRYGSGSNYGHTRYYGVFYDSLYEAAHGYACILASVALAVWLGFIIFKKKERRRAWAIALYVLGAAAVVGLVGLWTLLYYVNIFEFIPRI